MSISAPNGTQQPPTGDTHRYESFTDGVKLPGFGLPTKQCQRYVPRGVCEAGHIQLARSSCELRRCPDHWREWATRGTESAVARLAAYREAQSHAWDKRMVHVVLSPEWGERVTERRLWQRRSEAQQIAKDVGMRGGYMVVHPYRLTSELNELYRTAKDHGLPGDYKKWRFARELTGGRWDHLKQYLCVHPHYHVIGPARDVDVSGVDGWVVKKLSTLPRHELEDPEPYEATARMAWYQRSHAAHQAGRHSASWFGEVHPASFDPLVCTSCNPRGSGVVRDSDGRERPCPACGGSGEGPLSPAEWAVVLDMADHAVEPPGADDEAVCGCEDCEAPVFEMYELASRMATLEWWSTLDGTIKNQLLGLKLYWVDGMAVPPPEVAVDSERLLAWFERKGWEVAHGPTAPAPSTARALGDY